MLYRVQLYEQEPQYARLACGNACHQCAVCTMDIEIKSNIDSGTFRPMQLAAAQAYNNSVEWHEEANVNVYSRRRQLAEEIMKVLGCSFDPNQVGMFLWGRIPESYNDVEELTEKFCTKHVCSSLRVSSSAVTANAIYVFPSVPKKKNWLKHWKELKR